MSSLYLGVAAPVIVTDPASAETIKYAANAFLATKLSFVNAVAAICEGVGADVNDVVLGLGYDKRIGQDFLRPGPAGAAAASRRTPGRCSRSPTDAGYEFDLLRRRHRGQRRAVRPGRRRRSSTPPAATSPGRTIGVWGLTFKARTDDLRESPSVAIIERLLAAGATVRAHDPTVAGPKPGVPEAVVDLRRPVRGGRGRRRARRADRVGRLPLARLRARSPTAMPGRAVVDARNLLDRSEWRRAGFEYQGIGR